MNSPTKIAHSIDVENLDKEIRPFPATASKIVSLCNDADSRVTEITQLIECEPAVAIKLLAMANSPMFRAKREITSINHAIVLLGYRTVSQLALTIAAGPLFTSGDSSMMEHRTNLFRQSVGVATVSKLVADNLKLSDPAEAFLGGMMLDVGKLYFFDVVPKPYLEVLEQNSNGNTAEVEMEIFGTDHPTVGGHCGQKWGLPEKINNVIKNHHMSLHNTEDGLTRTILAGIYLSHKWNLGFSDEDGFEIREEIENQFSDMDVDDLEEMARTQFEAIISIFKI